LFDFLGVFALARKNKTWLVTAGKSSKARRDGDRGLELFVFNEECLVSASHQLALITSLPFVHTARRYYRLNGSASFTNRVGLSLLSPLAGRWL